MIPEDVRVINEWPKDKYDDKQLFMLIDKYKAYAEDYCNNEFSEPFPESVQLFIAKSIKHFEMEFLSGRSMGSVSYTFKNDVGLTKYLKRYRKMVW
ncbi:MAG: phage head-tail connector protein [Staphylococcus rostri]|uniref:phage head-tail connector protein n=1 Tax=Staphylococcus rostri TaxID=522262 RepID=UPI0026DFC6DC|nr:phage head-tail connector protein [Staphylococcus rostri]MDO5375695.1 phage head-tail connector protein [Staphylococcus rostri]